LGILALIQKNNLRIDAKEVFTEIGAVFIARAAFAGGWRSNLNENDARKQLGEAIFQASRHLAAEVTFFLQDRLIQQQRDFGVRGDLIRAGFEGLGRVDDFISLLARVHALQAFVTTDDGDNLLAGYKRAANILKKEGFTAGEGAQELSYTPEPAEKALIDALTAAAPRAAEAVEAERFADAMAALATLRAPIDRFFEEVTVNAEEADKRSRRLALLARFRDAVHRVADFSRIEG
jgi:glycyl-tRNA synthetase beta chain